MSEFFGRVVGAAAWAPFRISETRYARGAFLPRHRHEESYLTFVLAGGYRERSAGPLDRGDVVAGVDVAGIASRLAAEMRVADAAAELIVEGLLLELFGTVARGARDERRTPLWLAAAH